MNNPLKIALLIVLVVVVFIGIVAFFTSSSKTAQTDIHNRVPTPQSTTDAQKAAQDAQASASRAEEALKALQAEQEKQKEATAPPTVVYTNDLTPQEHTNVGHVTDVTEIWEPESSSNYGDAYMAFTFVEDGGFSKRFYPVCSDQTIQTGKSEIILYHWKPNKNNSRHNQKGCFSIDGYLQKGQL